MVAVATVGLAAPSARAFVRETTGYTTGTLLARPSGCVVLAVVDPKSPSVSWDDLVSATMTAAESWTQASGACGGGFRFEVAKAATSDSLGVEADGVNAVILRASNYCNSRSGAPTCDPLSLAVTWLYYTDSPGSAGDGQLYETDIEINAEAYDWGLTPDARTMDLQSALTHELGHALGLDHNCYVSGLGLPRPPDDQGNPALNCEAVTGAVAAATMNPQSDYATTRGRMLSDDDTAGVCAIYPAGTSPSCQGALAPAGCACAVTAGPGSAASSIGVGLLALLVSAGRGRRRPRGTGRAALVIATALGVLGCGGGGAAERPSTPCLSAPRTGEVCIKGGVFVMGHDKVPSGSTSVPQLQAPSHRVLLNPFFLDDRPVTNGEYLGCLNAGACPDECQTAGTSNSFGNSGCEGWGGAYADFFPSYHVRDPALGRYPVATIHDSGAEAYCASVGKRLPTEAEWERAARGPGDTDYPWGNEPPDCSRWGCDVVPLVALPAPEGFWPVGTYPVDRATGDVSAEGARMMVTGVAEILHDWYYDYPADYGEAIPDPLGDPTTPSHVGQTMRGNIWVLFQCAPDAACYGWFPQPAWMRGNGGNLSHSTLTGGFRCARDDEPQ